MNREMKSAHPDNEVRKESNHLFSLIVLLAALLMGIVLFGREFVLSLKAGDAIRGISDAPWVGFANYRELFSGYQFGILLRNTFLFNLLFAGMSLVMVTLLGSLLEVLPKWLKEVFAVFFGLLLFLPTEVFTGWIMHRIGTAPLVQANTMRTLFPFLCAVKVMGIPLILIALRNEIYTEKDGLAPVKIAGLHSLVSLVFLSSGYYRMTQAFVNPLNYETMDMLDTYSFRKGLMEMNAGINAATGVFQTIIALVAAAILFVPILALIRSTFRGERKVRSGENIVGRLIPSLIAFALFAAAYFVPYLNKGYSFDMGQLGQVALAGPVFSFVLVSAVSALIATALAAAMSGIFVGTGRGLKTMAGIILTLITVICAGPVRYSNYLLIKDMGWLNTVFAVIASTCFSGAAVWAMIGMRREEPMPAADNSFVQSMLALFLIQTALVYGNSTPHVLYLTRPDMSPLLILRQINMGMQAVGDATDRKSLSGVIGLYGFLVSLPPMLLFLAANIFLPKDKMMAVISAGMKS